MFNNEVQEFELIKIEYRDLNSNKEMKYTFDGRWIADYEDEINLEYYKAALTQGDRILYLYYDMQSDEGEHYVYDFYEDFISDSEIPDELRFEVAKELGEDYYVHLDI